MKKIVLFFVVVFLCCLTLTSTVEAGTYTVTNNNDSGAGSLRQAIIDANAVAGSHTLSFNGAIGTITLLSALSNLTKAVTFDLSSAVGTVVLTGNSASSSERVYFDNGAGSGTFTFDSGSSMVITDRMDVGFAAAGTAILNITNGGAVSNTGGCIGSGGNASTGTVTVDGANSTWTNSDKLYVGTNYHVTGTLNITNGGAVSNTNGFVGKNCGVGTVTVDGANSTWTNSGELYVGAVAATTGTLNITNGGAVSNVNGVIGEEYSAGTVTVDGANSTWTNSGDLTLGENANSTGTLNITNGGAVSVGGGTGTITLAGNATATGTLNIGTGLTAGTLKAATVTGGDGTATVNFNHNEAAYTFAPKLTGTLSVNQIGAGVTTLSGANTYTGGTTISAGTLFIDPSATTALGTGAVTNNATLDIGANTLNVTGVYTQNNNSKLKVTVSGTSTAGRISSASAAAVSAASEVDVTVTDNIYIPNKAAFKVIDGAAGTGVNTPGTITSSNPRVRFTALGSNGDLILTADRSGIGFSSLALNSNAAAAGGVLDNISTPSGDMTNILNTLEGLSNSQTASALDTVIPVVADNSVISTSRNALNRFTGTATDRLEGLVIQARNEGTGRTGVSTGSRGHEGFEAWGKGFGKYIHQKPRGLSNGYRATIWGTALGGDIPAFNNSLRLGLSGGYAQSGINSKDNSGRTDIDSYSSMLYGGYIDDTKPYYINGAFSFAYNTYEGSRQIAVGTIMRSANSDYDGRQYSALVDGGYTFKLKKLRLTPITSLQYTRLHLKEYTETGAGALNLNVRSQDYDMLQSGLGLKLERPFKIKSGTIVSEARFKWLYDFIGDRQETTATFSGGGGSFATEGFDPARNSFDMGTKLSLITEGGWSFEANYDFQYKEDFRSHAGWAGSRYRF